MGREERAVNAPGRAAHGPRRGAIPAARGPGDRAGDGALGLSGAARRVHQQRGEPRGDAGGGAARVSGGDPVLPRRGGADVWTGNAGDGAFERGEDRG